MGYVTRIELEEKVRQSLGMALEFAEEIYVSHGNLSKNELLKRQDMFGDVRSFADIICMLYGIVEPLKEFALKHYPQATPIIEWLCNTAESLMYSYGEEE